MSHFGGDCKATFLEGLSANSSLNCRSRDAIRKSLIRNVSRETMVEDAIAKIPNGAIVNWTTTVVAAMNIVCRATRSAYPVWLRAAEIGPVDTTIS